MTENSVQAVADKVKTSIFTLARCKRLHFEIERGVTDGTKQWEWFTPTIFIPVNTTDDRFPFKIASTPFKRPKYIEMLIAKKRRESTIIILMHNFGSFPKLFRTATMHVQAHVSFSPYIYDEKPAFTFIGHTATSITESNVPTEAEVHVPEYLQNIIPKVTIGDHIGNFTVQIQWKLPVNQQESNNYIVPQYLPYFPQYEMVNLIGRNGFRVEIEKHFLAASSFIFKGRLEQLEHHCPKNMCIFIGKDNLISAEGLLAFAKFLRTYSLKEVMKNSRLAFELLVAAHFNMVFKMERMLQTLLLVQSKEEFSLDTSFRLFLYASEVCSIINDEEEMAVWVNLKWKALRNMKGAKDTNSLMSASVPNCTLQTLDMFNMLLSVA